MINKIFFVFFCFFLFLSSLGWSKDYYISNLGNDGNDGLTEKTAWKTLDKLNNEMDRIQAGDNIFFHRGSTFYGTLKIYYLIGSSSSKISFKSYGDGNNPIITNGKLVENWTKYSGNIYVANVPETVYQVFRDGGSLLNGRTSNSSDYSIKTIGSQKVLTSEDLKGMKTLEGATIVLKVRSWYLNNSIISKFDPGSGRVEIDKAPLYDMKEGNEFFINNHLNLLDEQDEWSYNKSEQKLYIYSLSSPKRIISAVSDNNGVEIYNCSHVSISGIDVNFVNNAGIHINKSNNIELEKNSISYAYHSGILTENGRNITIKNNNIENSVIHGIYNYTDYSNLESNHISNTGMMKDMTYKQIGQSYGIKLKGSNNIVRNNDIVDTGYIGIRFYHENGLIENNLVKNFCLELSDGGGIYSFNTNFEDVGATGTVVKNNIVLGSNDANRDNIVVGLYADDRVHDIVFQNNSIANVDRGVFLHNTKRVEVLNNNIYKPFDVGISFGEDFRNGEMINNVINGNNVFLEETEIYKYAIKIKSKWDNYKMASFDNNRYYNPYSFKNIGIQNTSNYWLNSGNPKSLNLNEWQNKSNEDINSLENNFNWDGYILEEVFGKNLVINGDFEIDASNWGSPGTDLSVKEESGLKFLNVHPTTKGGAALSNKYQVKSNTEYLFEFDIKADSDLTLRLDVARTGAPYNGFMVRPIWVNREWQHYSIKINSDINATDMRINFYSMDGIIDFQLDNVVFQEVKTSPPIDKSFFAFNKGTKSMNVSIPSGVWEDLNGETYTGSILLAPFSSLILIVSNKTVSSIEANAGPDVTICKGEGTILKASGGSQYEWSSGETTQSITVYPESTTTYSVTVTNDSNSDMDDVVVTVNEVLANAGADRTITEGESISLTATGGDSYLWSTGATTETITVSPNATITYTVTAAKGLCEDMDEVKVTVNPYTGGGNPVIASAGSDISICKGESTTLTASGGSEYLWSTGETSPTIKVNPEITKTYTVTVSDDGESDTDEVIVTVNEVTANAGSDRIITEGETITLVATGGESYLWNTGEKTNSISVSPSLTKVYSVVAYKGTCQDMDEVRVSVLPIVDTDMPPAQADAGEDMTICLGETIVLNGSGGEIYLWNNGETSSSISVSPSRTATYELAATRGGVTNSDSVTITVENCESEINSDEEDLAILEMAVYPNPTNGKITIRINNLDQDANFIINDTKGSLIYSDYISEHKKQFEKQINLSRYSDGLYFVRLYSAEQYLVKKVMVQ